MCLLIYFSDVMCCSAFRFLCLWLAFSLWRKELTWWTNESYLGEVGRHRPLQERKHLSTGTLDSSVWHFRALKQQQKTPSGLCFLWTVGAFVHSLRGAAGFLVFIWLRRVQKAKKEHVYYWKICLLHDTNLQWSCQIWNCSYLTHKAW